MLSDVSLVSSVLTLNPDVLKLAFKIFRLEPHRDKWSGISEQVVYQDDHLRANKKIAEHKGFSSDMVGSRSQIQWLHLVLYIPLWWSGFADIKFETSGTTVWTYHFEPELLTRRVKAKSVTYERSPHESRV